MSPSFRSYLSFCLWLPCVLINWPGVNILWDGRDRNKITPYLNICIWLVSLEFLKPKQLKWRSVNVASIFFRYPFSRFRSWLENFLATECSVITQMYKEYKFIRISFIYTKDWYIYSMTELLLQKHSARSWMNLMPTTKISKSRFYKFKIFQVE